MTDVVLLGAGAIGRELLTQLGAVKTQGRIRICGVIDRSGYAFSPNGLTRKRFTDLCDAKARGAGIATTRGGRAATPAESVAAITSTSLESPVIVDVTAADTNGLLTTAIRRGFDVVLANKLPIASSQRAFDGLHTTARRHRRRILCEATVGAGLPVLDTLQKLLSAGDTVLSIEGCPSGTLGFLFGELERGVAFSEALRRAIDAGYTEPDARIDLSGLDVARKALILGRQIGFRGDLADVSVESLVPPELADVNAVEFVSRAGEMDAALQMRTEVAAQRGTVLRYRAHVTRDAVAVGVCEVSRGDPLASLSGTDNQFTFTTMRYHERKLVITGPGAGASVTAAGVHNDILRLDSIDRFPRRLSRAVSIPI
jgi:aspartokinase/homoserine dehydrogenase 1